MNDQAEGLRQIIFKLQQGNRDKDRSSARIITVTSGKGGVGKTSFTTSLGVSLGQRGYRVVIIDGDFGLANVDLMLGITSKFGLKEMILGHMTLDDVLVEGPQGVRFISGGSGIKELINLSPHQINGFLSRIDELNRMADIILIDTGAGATENIVKMVLAAHEVILLVTPEPTALTDAYALTKIISLARQDIDLRLVVNKAETMEEAQDILSKFTKTAERFLGIDIRGLGFLYEDPRVPKSIKEQVPYVLSYPKSQAARQVETIARRLLNEDEYSKEDEGGLTSYFKRFLGFFNL